MNEYFLSIKAHKLKTFRDAELVRVSKKGNILEELLNCGLGYYHIKRMNMSNYFEGTITSTVHGQAWTPHFEVTYGHARHKYCAE